MEVGEIWFKDFYNSAGGIKKRKEKKKGPRNLTLSLPVESILDTKLRWQLLYSELYFSFYDIGIVIIL